MDEHIIMGDLVVISNKSTFSLPKDGEVCFAIASLGIYDPAHRFFESIMQPYPTKIKPSEGRIIILIRSDGMLDWVWEDWKDAGWRVDIVSRLM